MVVTNASTAWPPMVMTLLNLTTPPVAAPAALTFATVPDPLLAPPTTKALFAVFVLKMSVPLFAFNTVGKEPAQL